jgi:flavin-dependent thymidylate synthase
LKHRIASINAESARYKELKEDKYYIPDDWNEKWAESLKKYTELGNTLYHECLKDLEPLLGRKRAKESARFFKTYNSKIQADVMFNMRSFANFQKLRNSEHAQKEIREIAQKMLELVYKIEGNPFKYTLETWKRNKLF